MRAQWLAVPPARVLDVGGASGAYASWLSERGYQVQLIDPVPLHRAQATADGRFTVAAGDARGLEEDDSSYDAVLLPGPLYHLTDRADRVRALAEARHVSRPDGIVAAAVISRYATARVSDLKITQDMIVAQVRSHRESSPMTGRRGGSARFRAGSRGGRSGD